MLILGFYQTLFIYFTGFYLLNFWVKGILKNEKLLISHFSFLFLTTKNILLKEVMFRVLLNFCFKKILRKG